jgi:hypothetical protein
MFKRFQMLKKGVETIKKVAPSVGSALGKKKVDLLKKMGKTQRTNPENFKKAGGDKLKKEILAAETRVKKAVGGILGRGKPATEQKKGDTGKQKKKPPFDKADKPATARPDNKGQKLTPDQSKKVKEGIKEKI